MHTDEGTEARRWLVVRWILITVVVYIEIVSFSKIIVGRTPASDEHCFGSNLAIESSLNSNTCWSCSRSSFSNYSNPKSFVNLLLPPQGIGEGWGGVKNLRLLQELLYCWIKYFRAVMFVVKFYGLSPAILTRKLQLLFSVPASFHTICHLFSWQ